MSEMIERVARAIWEDVTCGTGNDGSGQRVTPNYYESSARAAIEAMREPTEGMIQDGDAWGDWDSKTIYKNMIDAALR